MRWIGAIILVFVMAGVTVAQTPPQQKIDDLVRLLEDPEIRTWLDSRKPSQPEVGTEITAGLVSWEASTRTRLKAVVTAIPRIPSELASAATRTRQDTVLHGYGSVLLILMGLIAAGAIGERLFLRKRNVASNAADRFLALAVFSLTMTLVFVAVPWPPLARIVLMAALVGIAVYRIVSLLVGLAGPDSRLARRIRVFFALLVMAVCTAAVSKPLGMDMAAAEAMSWCWAAVLLGIAVEAVFTTSARSVKTKIAVALSLVLLWMAWCLGLDGVFWLGVYALVLPSLVTAVGRAAATLVPSDPLSIRQVLLTRGSRAIVVLLAVAWLALVWRNSMTSLVYDDPAAKAIAYGVLKSVVVLLMADLAWHLCRAWIDRTLTSTPDEAALLPAKAAKQARIRTLLPIIRNVLAVTVVVIVALIVLAQLGVEIGPLIAGAGVFGVALGFGAQTLVKDVISGIFYMVDDAFRVGEYIQAKTYKGTVEGFSLRSVRLRHHRGPVFTVPFGELGAVENMSRDWAVVKFIISVGFDTDVAKVKSLTKAVGKELRKDPEFAPLVIEDLKMKGVEKFGDYGIDLSFGMVLRPSGLQSMVRRRAYSMIRQAFLENQISFATPSVNVGGDDKAGAAVAATALNAAKAAQVSAAEKV